MGVTTSCVRRGAADDNGDVGGGGGGAGNHRQPLSSRLCCLSTNQNHHHHQGGGGGGGGAHHSTGLNHTHHNTTDNILAASFDKAQKGHLATFSSSRSMKVLLVSSAIINEKEEPLLQALERLNITFHRASDIQLIKSLFSRNRHDVIIIDRRVSQIQLADEACLWFKESDCPPCCIVAIEDLISATGMKELLLKGYSRCVYEHPSVSYWENQLIQLEANDFQWGLNKETLNAIQTALDNVSDPVEIADHRFTIQYVNSAFERVMGRSRKQLLGRRVTSTTFPLPRDFGCGIGYKQAALMSGTDDNIINNATFNSINQIIVAPSAVSLQSMRPVTAANIRRKSVPELKQNYSPDAVYPIVKRDGSVGYYVTIRRLSKNPIFTCNNDHLNGNNSIKRRHSIDVAHASLSSQKNEITRHRHSVTIEAPIHKIIHILRQAQESSNVLVAQDLQHVLDILQTTDLYATHRQSLTGRDSDPATSDLIDNLLSTSRTFQEGDRRKSVGVSLLSKNGCSKVGLEEIPEDISESLEGDDCWDYDILHLESVTKKRPLKFLALKICDRFDVTSVLHCGETCLANWLSVVEDHYHMDNPYHNATHAADVMQSSAYFLQKDLLKDVFSQMDEVATILASIVHDMDHPGRTNPFLINSRARLAIVYNDMAVLESHHVSLCFQLTSKDERIDIFKNMSTDDYKLLRQYMIDMVLATEMAKHFEHLTKFMNIVQKKPLLDGGTHIPDLGIPSSDDASSSKGHNSTNPNEILHVHEEYVEYLRQADCRANIRRMLIKCSDISNPTRSLALCSAWAERIAEEYFSQTDEEKTKNLPVVMPWFDRATCNIPKSQLGFIDFFLKNMIEAWDAFLDVPDLVDNLKNNYKFWTSLLDSNSQAEAKK